VIEPTLTIRPATTLRQEHAQHGSDGPGYVTEVEVEHEIPVLIRCLVQRCRLNKGQLATDHSHENVESAEFLSSTADEAVDVLA
jgi:hypothetical protein